MSPVAYTNAPAAKSQPARPTPKQAALEDLTRRVRETSDHLQRVLSPYAERVKVFAEARPVIFTFAAIFFVLSCVPVACTALFVLCVAGLFTGIAIFLLCLSIVGIVGLAMTFLLPVLVLTASLSAMAVGVLLALFLSHRLYLHIRSDCEYTPGLSGVLSGIQSWMDETLGRIGVGSSEYGPHFDGRSIDYHRPTYTSTKPYRGERDYDHHRAKASPASVKHEQPEVHDMFSPHAGTPNELRSRDSQIYDDDWVSDDGAQ